MSAASFLGDGNTDQFPILLYQMTQSANAVATMKNNNVKGEGNTHLSGKKHNPMEAICALNNSFPIMSQHTVLL